MAMRPPPTERRLMSSLLCLVRIRYYHPPRSSRRLHSADAIRGHRRAHAPIPAVGRWHGHGTTAQMLRQRVRRRFEVTASSAGDSGFDVGFCRADRAVFWLLQGQRDRRVPVKKVRQAEGGLIRRASIRRRRRPGRRSRREPVRAEERDHPAIVRLAVRDRTRRRRDNHVTGHPGAVLRGQLSVDAANDQRVCRIPSS
jgi:hypothetical protein